MTTTRADLAAIYALADNFEGKADLMGALGGLCLTLNEGATRNLVQTLRSAADTALAESERASAFQSQMLAHVLEHERVSRIVYLMLALRWASVLEWVGSLKAAR